METPTPPSPSWTPSLTSTLPPTPSNCPPPPGWVPYIVQSGDTVAGLALEYNVTITEVSQANCLWAGGLLPGAVVYLPPQSTHTPISCNPPHTWVIYIVQPGDTLYRLGQAYGISYTEIKRANCLPNFNLYIGQRIYVPPWATRTPSPTIPFLPSLTQPTDTPTATFTDTPTSDTCTPSPTESPYPLPYP